MLRQVPDAEARPFVFCSRGRRPRVAACAFQDQFGTVTLRDPMAIGNIGFPAFAPDELSACCAPFRKTGRIPVWRTDRNVYVPRHAGISGGGIFQTAVECRDRTS